MRRTTWPEAIRAVAVAVAAVVVLLVAGANFVIVEVRILGLVFDTRLSWALLVALAFGIVIGVFLVTPALWRARRRRGR